MMGDPTERPQSARAVTGAVLLCILALGGCESGLGLTLSAPSDAEANLPPVHAWRVGDRYHFSNPDVTWTVIRATSNETVWRSDRGDEAVTGTDPILPPRRWRDADLGTGSYKSVLMEGNVFPLRLGNNVRFQLQGSSTQKQGGWTLQLDCVEKAVETVEVPAGRFETMRIECSGPAVQQTHYYAPAIGHVVKRIDQGQNRPAIVRELLSVQLAATPAPRTSETLRFTARPATTASATTSPTARAPESTASGDEGGGWAAWVASAKTRAERAKIWARLQAHHGELRTLKLVEVASPAGSLRVAVGPLDKAGAEALCRRLKAVGEKSCIAVRRAGA